jgi:hypothetical protein
MSYVDTVDCMEHVYQNERKTVSAITLPSERNHSALRAQSLCPKSAITLPLERNHSALRGHALCPLSAITLPLERNHSALRAQSLCP